MALAGTVNTFSSLFSITVTFPNIPGRRMVFGLGTVAWTSIWRVAVLMAAPMAVILPLKVWPG